MARGAGTGGRTKQRRGGGGCCGCLILVLALVIGVFFLARKWAPNHLNAALHWSRGQVVKYLPHPSAPLPTPPLTTPGPTPSPSPEPAATTRAFEILATPPAFTELVVGTGAEARLGQSVLVRYGAERPTRAPELLMLGASDASPELEAGIRGMKVGGKRKIGETEVELIQVL